MQMQGSTRRRITAIDDRCEIGKPETGKGNYADSRCDDRIEELSGISLQFDCSSALGV